MNTNDKLKVVTSNIIDFTLQTARLDATYNLPKIKEDEFLSEINNLNLLDYELQILKQILNDDKKFEEVIKKIYNIYSKEYDKFKAPCNYTTTNEWQ